MACSSGNVRLSHLLMSFLRPINQNAIGYAQMKAYVFTKLTAELKRATMYGTEIRYIYFVGRFRRRCYRSTRTYDTVKVIYEDCWA